MYHSWSRYFSIEAMRIGDKNRTVFTFQMHIWYWWLLLIFKWIEHAETHSSIFTFRLLFEFNWFVLFFIYIYTYLHICIFVSDRSSAIRETERVVLPVGLCIKRLSNICLGNIIRAQYLYRQVQCKCKIIRKAQSKAKLCQSHAIINFIIVIIISYFFSFL